QGDGCDEARLRAVGAGALGLRLGLAGKPERHVGDRDAPAAAAGAELDDPAVVRARVRLRESQVLALGLPEDAESRVEDGDVQVLAVEALEALLGVPRAEARVAQVGEAGAGAGGTRDVADEGHGAEAGRASP